MAVFDPELQRICVRVVYDGPAHAGKTTNVRQLAAMFPSRHATEVITPSELEGRTLSFDWLQIRAGVVAGFPLICQVITVPGQTALTPRRKYLLGTADVIVYVCDSLEAELASAREGLALLRDVSAKQPLILQANKQDQIGALTARALSEALGLDGAPLVEAIAREGVGVVDTFVNAVRTVSRTMQERIEAGDFRIAVRRTETPHELLSRLADEQLDPEAAAEMLLAQLSGALEVQAPTEIDAAIEIEAPPLRDVPSSRPRLPRHDVPPGHVWPAHTGRATLEALSAAAGEEVDDPRAVRIGEWLLSTSTRDRYADVESARAAIVRAARERTQLGTLLAPETVLVLQAASDGAVWLWRLHAARETCDVAFARAVDAADIERFARAVAELLRIASKNHFSIELSISSFAIDEAVRYVGPIGALEDGSALGDAFTGLLAELSARKLLEVFLPAFDRAVSELSSDERTSVEHAVRAPVPDEELPPTVRPAPMPAA